MLATLKFPIMGYTRIRLLVKNNYKWLAKLLDVDLEIEVTEDDFVLD